jgi:hypothetical protein
MDPSAKQQQRRDAKPMRMTMIRHRNATHEWGSFMKWCHSMTSRVNCQINVECDAIGLEQHDNRNQGAEDSTLGNRNRVLDDNKTRGESR